MKRISQIALNLFVLILMVLNPLSSYGGRYAIAQSISDMKSDDTVDIIASKIWEGGPDVKPDIWFMLMRQNGAALEEVPGIMPKKITNGQSVANWTGLPKYNADGSEIVYTVREGFYNPLSGAFIQGAPQGYQAAYGLGGFVITNTYIGDDLEPPVEPEEPIDPTEKPVETVVPTEEPADPIEPTAMPTEETVAPTEPVFETPDPVEPTEPPAETPDPVKPTEPPVETPDPIELPVETPQPKSLTATIIWQGGELPRPAFWLKLQKVNSFGDTIDVSGTDIIQANMLTQVTWNLASFDEKAGYTVIVVDQDGNPITLPNYATMINGLNVTFTYIEPSISNDVVANVEWLVSLDPKEAIDFEQNPDLKAPTVYLRLYRQANENEIPVGLLTTDLIELSHGQTSATWHDMPKTNNSGTPYIYSVKQVDADGNDFTPEGYRKIESGLLVQNLFLGDDGPGLRDIFDPLTPTHTYIFKNGEEVIDTQIIKNGESLFEPEVPEKADHKFTGWWVTIDGVESELSFGTPITVNETMDIIVTSHFELIYYVFFMDTTGTSDRVFVTKEGITGDIISTTDVNLPLNSNLYFDGWYLDKNCTPPEVGDSFTIGTADQQLWPKIVEGHYLIFVAGERASYVAPQFVPQGSHTSAPENPTRAGYTFKHWSLQENGTVPFAFGQPLTEDLTLYAVWEPAQTTYTVVFWKQSILDDKNAADAAKTYDYAESVQRTALTGSSVAPTTADGEKNYNGFHYNAGKSVAVTVNGDGTTVLTSIMTAIC